MEFVTFCNICLNSDYHVEEHENVSNILILFIGNREIVEKSKVYLCRSCCKKLEEYENFRNMCTTNILEFRYLYFKLKRKLEADDDPEMDNKLRNFINAKLCNKGDNSVYEEIETTCATFKDIKYDIEIKGIKCEENTIHNEIDFENENATHLNPLQYNTFDIKVEDMCTMEANEGNQFEHKLHTEVDLENEVVSLDIQTTQHYSDGHSNIKWEVNSSKENVDAEKSSQTEVEENENFSTGTTSNKYNRKKRVCARSRSTHKFTRHDNVRIRAKSYTCKVCDRAFTFLSTLITHQRIHTGDKPYTCNVCDKAFTQSSNLTQHQRIHSGEKPYSCNVCDKAFTYSSHLKEHQRIHSGDKPYTCNMCNKAFTVSSSLILHQRIHSGAKPYTCNVCDKAFTVSSSLIAHQRIHSGDKPYTCSVCDKAFTLSSNLKRHQQVHSEDKPFTCNVCGKAFTLSSNLKRHQRIHSGDKP